MPTCEKCNQEKSGCRCDADETEKLITEEGDNEDFEKNDESFISTRSFPKIIPPEIILGIKHSKFAKEQIEILFGDGG